jgi:hypothetical protein
MTVLKVHFDNLRLKACAKGERVHRFEAIVHNTRVLGCGRVIARLPVIAVGLQELKGVQPSAAGGRLARRWKIGTNTTNTMKSANKIQNQSQLDDHAAISLCGPRNRNRGD